MDMELYETVETPGKSKKLAACKAFVRAHPEALLQCVFAATIFFLGTYRLSDLHMPVVYSDEYGYWAASAFFMGDDWSSVTSRIPYYSYGYGLLLVPLRFLSRLFSWSWWMLYEAAVVLNACMLVGSYFLACGICKRYMGRMGRFVRSMACFAVVVYSSNTMYAHMTWTENTLYFFFWVFLYVLMRCVDAPGIGNHACLALSAWYLYAVHQRAVAELIAAALIVVYMKLVGENTLRQTGAFFGSFFLCGLVHAMVKGKLQNDFYIGNPPAGVPQTLSYACSLKTLVLLMAFLFLMALLYLQETKRRRLLLLLLCAAAAAGALLLAFTGGFHAAQGGDFNLTVNDFAGQWEKVERIFSRNGILRLLISITGKCFYLAAATGLVICWGMGDFAAHVFWMAADFAGRTAAWLKGAARTGGHVMAEHRKEDIWKLGAALCCGGSLLVCAIYKEGLYKVDDLLNGRYNEFVAGILILGGFYCLLTDRHWVRTLIICLVLYMLAGSLCQYTLDELQRTDFELAHSVMLGRVFWNWEVPVGKIRVLSRYVLPLGISFIMAVKVFSNRLQGHGRVTAARCLLALLIPAIAWGRLSMVITDHYTVSVNEKHRNHAPDIYLWVSSLDREGEFPVYFMEDQENFRWAEEIQFALQDHPVTLTTAAEALYEEDAFFITGRAYGDSEEAKGRFTKVMETSRFALLVSRDQELMRRLGGR